MIHPSFVVLLLIALVSTACGDARVDGAGGGTAGTGGDAGAGGAPVPPGPVTIELSPPGGEVIGGEVFVHAPDGSHLGAVPLDPEGTTTTVPVPAGGTVTLGLDSGTFRMLSTATGVHPGDHLVFEQYLWLGGPEVELSFELPLDPPPGTHHYELRAGCSGQVTDGRSGSARIFSRCLGPEGDMLVVFHAMDASGELIASVSTRVVPDPRQVVQVDLRAATWREATRRVIALENAPSGGRALVHLLTLHGDEEVSAASRWPRLARGGGTIAELGLPSALPDRQVAIAGFFPDAGGVTYSVVVDDAPAAGALTFDASRDLMPPPAVEWLAGQPTRGEHPHADRVAARASLPPGAGCSLAGPVDESMWTVGTTSPWPDDISRAWVIQGPGLQLEMELPILPAEAAARWWPEGLNLVEPALTLLADSRREPGRIQVLRAWIDPWTEAVGTEDAGTLCVSGSALVD